MQKIIIVGYYGANNFGDDLMLEGLLSSIGNKSMVSILGFGNGLKLPLLKKNCQYKFLSIRGGKSIKNKLSALSKMIFELSDSSLVVFGGGTILFDNVSNGYRNLFGPLKVVLLSKLLFKKIGLYGCGIGELESGTGLKIAEFILNACNFICLRDSISMSELDKFKINRKKKVIKLVNDPAFMVPVKTIKNFSTQKYQIISLMETHYRSTGCFDESLMIDLLIRYIYRQSKRRQRIIFLPMQEGTLRNDNNIHLRLYNRLDNNLVKYVKLSQGLDYSEKKSLLFNAESIISMRYHPLVVGKMSGIKTLALIVSRKCRNFVGEHLTNYEHVDMIKNNWYEHFERKLDDFSLLKSRPNGVVVSESDEKNTFRELLLASIQS